MNWAVLSELQSENTVLNVENIALRKELEILRHSYETYRKTTKVTLDLIQREIKRHSSSLLCSDGLPETIVIYDE